MYWRHPRTGRENTKSLQPTTCHYHLNILPEDVSPCAVPPKLWVSLLCLFSLFPHTVPWLPHCPAPLQQKETLLSIDLHIPCSTKQNTYNHGIHLFRKQESWRIILYNLNIPLEVLHPCKQLIKAQFPNVCKWLTQRSFNTSCLDDAFSPYSCLYARL